MVRLCVCGDGGGMFGDIRPSINPIRSVQAPPWAPPCSLSLRPRIIRTGRASWICTKGKGLAEPISPFLLISPASQGSLPSGEPSDHANQESVSPFCLGEIDSFLCGMN